MTATLRLWLMACLMCLAACSSPQERKGGGGSEAVPPPTYLLALPEDLRGAVDKRFTGDSEEMLKRRLIRVAVPYNRTQYFIDKGVQRGMTYEYLKLFEDELNKAHETGQLPVHIVFLPLPRDALLPALTEGRVDMVAAQLTVTPERLKQVDFTQPTRTGINEVVVTGPGSKPLASPDELSGTKVFVRKSSSYFASIEALNRRLKAQGKAPVAVEEAPESLEDDDLLEMVNAGLIPATVADDYLARFWQKVLPKLQIQDRAPLRTGASLAVAIRKNSPALAAELNGFIARHPLDSAMGRVLNAKYLQSTKFVTDAASQDERQKLLSMIDMFRKYGDEYQLDYLLMAAQGYQESRLDQQAKSAVGAIGVMQVMPATGQELAVGDIKQTDPNIHAGLKYIRFMMDRYYKDEPMDRLNKGLFTFASYNAGPARIAKLRKEAAARGLNPNVWFGNVEQVASERIGRETVTYVSNIYKYYIAYRLVMRQREEKEKAKAAIGAASD